MKLTLFSLFWGGFVDIAEVRRKTRCCCKHQWFPKESIFIDTAEIMQAKRKQLFSLQPEVKNIETWVDIGILNGNHAPNTLVLYHLL